jgi:ribosomal protein S14
MGCRRLDHRPRRSRPSTRPICPWLPWSGPAAGLDQPLPGPVSVTRCEVQAQAIRRLAARVGRGRAVLREAPVSRVRVREVAATIGDQPQEGAGGSVRSIGLDAGHPGDDSPRRAWPGHPPGRHQAGVPRAWTRPIRLDRHSLLRSGTIPGPSNTRASSIGTRQGELIVLRFEVRAGARSVDERRQLVGVAAARLGSPD